MKEVESAPKRVFELHLTPEEQRAADLGELIAGRIAELDQDLPIEALPRRSRMIPNDWTTNDRDKRFIARTFKNLAGFSLRQAFIKELYKDIPEKPYTFYVPSLQTVGDASRFEFEKYQFLIKGLGPITLQFVSKAFRRSNPEQSLTSNIEE